MKATEIREQSAEELQQVLLDLLKDQFNLRMQKATGQLAQNHMLGRYHRDHLRSGPVFCP